MQRLKNIQRTTWLLFLCWLIYTVSLLGKVNYAANITQIESFYKVSHADAGMASTFYFFAYGIGQVVNGILCKKYNLKYVIFGGLFISGLMNFLVAFLGNFAFIKYAWLINGFALSVLWPCLIRLLSETMPKKEMVRASVAMGTSTAAGTVIIYSASALFVAIADFTWAFYMAAIALPLVGAAWLVFYNRLAVKVEDDEEEDTTPIRPSEKPQKGAKMPKELLVVICLLCFVSVATNLIKDGLTTWVPSILKESFALDASFSILLTLALPLVGIFGNLFANTLYKKMKNFLAQTGLLFFGAAILIGVVIGALALGSFVIALIGFALVYFLVGSSNSTVTSIFPLQMKGKLNSGLIAGVLNGFCYVGSTISSYGLGLVADAWGWETVFYLLLGVAVAVVVIALVYNVVKSFKKKPQTYKDRSK